MERKKITIISAAYPYRGGIANFAGALYTELQAHTDVNMVTFTRQYPEFLFPGKTQLEVDSAGDNIKSERLIDSINPVNWIKVGRKIKKEAPDLLIIKFWMPFFAPCFGTIAKIVKGNNKTKIMLVCHNIIPHEKTIIDTKFTKFLFDKADSFVTLSKSVQNDLLNLYPNAKERLLFHPVYSHFGEAVDKNLAKERLGFKSEKIILFFGFIRDYKGLDVLLNTIPILKNKLDDFKLVIAGEFYSNEEKYRQQIESLQIEKDIILKSDFIPTEEVKYYFSASDVVVLPYKTATQSGIVQIANNFFKPVIAADVGGLSEIIYEGETGYVVPKENPEAIAEKLTEFYNSNKELVFTENLKKEPDRFSWKKFTNGVLELAGFIN